MAISERAIRPLARIAFDDGVNWAQRPATDALAGYIRPAHGRQWNGRSASGDRRQRRNESSKREPWI